MTWDSGSPPISIHPKEWKATPVDHVFERPELVAAAPEGFGREGSDGDGFLPLASALLASGVALVSAQDAAAGWFNDPARRGLSLAGSRGLLPHTRGNT